MSVVWRPEREIPFICEDGGRIRGEPRIRIRDEFVDGWAETVDYIRLVAFLLCPFHFWILLGIDKKDTI